MFCPICRVEHREGFTRCMECDVDLVNELPTEQGPEYENLVSVFEGALSSAALALTLLKSAGIESWSRDEEVHALFPNMGLSQVLVREEDQEAAEKALNMPEPDMRSSHGAGPLTTKHSPNTSDADKKEASGDRVTNSRITKSKHPKTAAKNQQDSSSCRHGKHI